MGTKTCVGVVVGGLMTLSAAASAADDCKPSVSGKDKLTKKETMAWSQEVSGTGFASRVVMENANVTVSVLVGREGDTNIVQAAMSKAEEPDKAARVLLESGFKAEKGDQFHIGFKEGGDPLSFTATQAVSRTARSAGLFKKLTTMVILAAEVKDEDLPKLKEALGSRQPDTIRLDLSSGPIDKNISEGNGKKLVEKFNCFFAFAEKEGFLK